MNALHTAFGRLSVDQLVQVKKVYQTNFENAKTDYEKEVSHMLLSQLDNFLTEIENNYLNNWRTS